MKGRFFISSESLNDLAYFSVLPETTEVQVFAYTAERRRLVCPDAGTHIVAYICRLLNNGAHKVEVRYKIPLGGEC